MDPIYYITIHCSATRNAVSLAKNGQTAAAVIDDWHSKRGFKRSQYWRAKHNEHLQAIGYHFIIDIDGTLETGRAIGEKGAHVKGYNTGNIGICLVGGVSIDGKNYARFTKAQWRTLHELLVNLQRDYPNATVLGHRDFDGVHKDCPCFDVRAFLSSPNEVASLHLFKE